MNKKIINITIASIILCTGLLTLHTKVHAGKDGELPRSSSLVNLTRPLEPTVQPLPKISEADYIQQEKAIAQTNNIALGKQILIEKLKP